MTRTECPVVLIHGVFGYGRKRPFWNRGKPYWPERALDELNANYLVVDVGALSSDHDRACEAFYQLYGGRVDYGDAHSKQFGHDRFGETFDRPTYPTWSAQHPVHLLGHSVGATTAIELYQLICQDYFGVGSDHTWVTSIVSIAGPLSGTTLTHFFGLHDAKLVSLTLGHFIGASLCLWHRLQSHFPLLKNVFDYRMPQWEFVTSYREILSSKNRILLSPDLAVYDILPARRLARNQALRDMDKPFLISVVTSSTSRVPTMELSMVFAIALLALASAVCWHTIEAVEISLACGLVAAGAYIWLRKRIFLPMIQWRMRRCVQTLHEIFDGFDRSEWEHNDGAVNICSMHYPQHLPSASGTTTTTGGEMETESSSDSDASTVSSSMSQLSTPPPCPAPAHHPLEVNQQGLLAPAVPLEVHGMILRSHKTRKRVYTRGQWYIHKVPSNHKAGTSFDKDAPQLFHQLLEVIANNFEHQ